MITAQGRALADRHRVAQGRIGQITLAQMLKIWPLLVAGGKVDANTPQWLEVATMVLAAQRAQSAALAVQFATAYRLVEHGTVDGFAPKPAVDLNLEALRTSLMVTGPLAYKKQVAKQLGKGPGDLTPVEVALNRAAPGIGVKIAASNARAAIRHVQNGARETLDDVITNDAPCIGYVRTTAINPCWFCAMLASRGPVYDDNSFEDSDPRFQGPGDQKVHDGCGCMLLPMYRRPATAQEQAAFAKGRELDALWRKTGSIKTFREAYEASRTA